MPGRLPNTRHFLPLRKITVADPCVEEIQAEYAAKRALFSIQPTLIQKMIELQASDLARKIQKPGKKIGFFLPVQVYCGESRVGPGKALLVPPNHREQIIRCRPDDALKQIRQRLFRLEGSSNPAVSTGAVLTRHALALHLLKSALLPNQPASADECDEVNEKLDLKNANDQLKYLQQKWEILHAVELLAPYLAVEEEFQLRQRLLKEQTQNLGHRIVTAKVEEIIAEIRQRGEEGSLNRGLSISLPYFDDSSLKVKKYDFEVIPTGRVSFVPGYVMWAAIYEQSKVERNLRFSPSTRKALLDELKTLEKAFEIPEIQKYRSKWIRRENSLQGKLASLYLNLISIPYQWIQKD